MKIPICLLIMCYQRMLSTPVSTGHGSCQKECAVESVTSALEICSDAILTSLVISVITGVQTVQL